MKSRPNKLWARILLTGVCAFPVGCVLLMLLYLHGNSSNHTGLEFLLALWPLGLALLLAAGLLCFTKMKLAIAAVALNIIAILFFLAIDHYNIMVQYDRWLKRGMPAPFEQSIHQR